MGLLDRIPTPGLRRWLRSGGRLTFRGASITLFVVLVGLLALAAAASSSAILVALATFVLFYALKGALPDDKIDQFTTDLMTGDVGERWYDRTTAALATLRRRLQP